MTDRSGYVYLLKSDRGVWKIGRTKYPNDRRHTFGVKLPYMVEYEHLIPCKDAVRFERTLHSRYGRTRMDGEWFKLSDEQVEFIKAIQSDEQYEQEQEMRRREFMENKTATVYWGELTINARYHVSHRQDYDTFIRTLELPAWVEYAFRDTPMNQATFDFIETQVNEMLQALRNRVKQD